MPQFSMLRMDSQRLFETAKHRILRGGRDGRAVYLKLFLISQKDANSQLETQLVEVLSQMPNDDRLIIEFIMSEFARADSVYFF